MSKKNIFQYNSATLTGTYFKDGVWLVGLTISGLAYLAFPFVSYKIIKQHENDTQKEIVVEDTTLEDTTLEDTIQENNNEIIEIKTTNEELSTYINNGPENYEIYEIIQDENSDEVIIRYIKEEKIKNQSKNRTLKIVMPS